MQKYTNQQYKEIFNKLPQEIRDAVSSYDGVEKIWKIGEAHKLQIDQIGKMHEIVLDIMMGIISTKNFAKVLAEELNISPLEAANLSRDIDENIFKPIKKSMITMYGEGAPNKPSSSLVQFYEEEDEHKELSKESILREIESPSPAIVRKEVSLGAEKLSSLKGIQEKIGTEIEIYPEEITGKVLEIKENVSADSLSLKARKLGSFPVSKLPPSPEASTEVDTQEDTSFSPSFLKIADMKLSQAMVMPKMESLTDGQLLSLQVDKLKTKEAERPLNLVISETKVKEPKKITPPLAPAIDPYRESIN